jgi:DNA-directed RNA polymerase specialized sigma24 family protein
VTSAPQPNFEPADDFSGSVTGWIDQLKGGNPAAAQRLWTRYFRQMLRFSRSRLWGSDRLASDEEDLALSAFKSFCRGAGSGRFDAVHDREELWPLLVGIMARKAADQVAYERRAKRGGGTVVRAEDDVLEKVKSPDPPPDLAAQMAEEFQRLLDRLPEPSLRTVAILKLEGHTSDGIARHLGCGVRTVERKLLLIRRLWSEDRT